MFVALINAGRLCLVAGRAALSPGCGRLLPIMAVLGLTVWRGQWFWVGALQLQASCYELYHQSITVYVK